MDIQDFVQNVKHLLDERGISCSRAGRESGAGIDFIRDMDRKGSWPSTEKILKMANYLGVTVSELLGERPPGAPAVPGPLAQDEQQLLHDYRALNAQGKEYIRQTMHMAVQIYKKSSDLSELEGQG